jgi:hypothetical protein
MKKETKKQKIAIIKRQIQASRKYRLDKIRHDKKFLKYDKLVKLKKDVEYSIINDFVEEHIGLEPINKILKKDPEALNYYNSFEVMLWSNLEDSKKGISFLMTYFIKRRKDDSLKTSQRYAFRLASFIKKEEIKEAFKDSNLSTDFTFDYDLAESKYREINFSRVYNKIQDDLKDKLDYLGDSIKKIESLKKRLIEEEYQKYDKYYNDEEKRRIEELEASYA